MTKKIHFFRISKPNYNWFRLIHYLSIKSFTVYNPNCNIVLHIDKVPEDSNWWHLLMYECGNQIIVDTTIRSEWEKSKDKWKCVNHFIDQFAAETVYDYGGLICDMDMICLKSIEDLFFHDDEFLNIESELDYYERYTTALGIGLMSCNRGNLLIRDYLDQRHNYNKTAEWGEFSTELMFKLYTEKPEWFRLIPQSVVDPFGPQRSCLQDLFLHNITLPDYVRCIHTSESVSWDEYLKHLDVEHIMTVNTTFTRAVRRLIGDVWDSNSKKCLINLY